MTEPAKIIDLDSYRPSWASEAIEYTQPETVSHRTGRHILHALAEEEAMREPRRSSALFTRGLIVVVCLFVGALVGGGWLYLEALE